MTTTTVAPIKGTVTATITNLVGFNGGDYVQAATIVAVNAEDATDYAPGDVVAFYGSVGSAFSPVITLDNTTTITSIQITQIIGKISQA